MRVLCFLSWLPSSAGAAGPSRREVLSQPLAQVLTESRDGGEGEKWRRRRRR